MNDLLDTLAVVTRALEQARAALEAANATLDPRPDAEGKAVAGPQEEFIACTPKQLPRRLLVEAAKTATELNPQNAPHLQGPTAVLGEAARALLSDPLHIAVLTTKYWGPDRRVLPVSFMEQTAADLRDRILSHMNAWSEGKPGCGISFKWSQSQGQIRISRGPGGYYSYLGIDVLHIPPRQQTMNLERFTMQTRDSEFYRVVRHETGHTLGFPHEHMRREEVARLDPQKTFEYFRRNQGWDAETVRQQVLTALEDRDITAPGLEPTPADQTSIMCYQLPAEITRDGNPIPGGTDIDASDYEFAARIYPKPGGEGGDDDDCWSA
jgi:hypothetical protein